MSKDRPYTKGEIAAIIKDAADIRTKVAIELLSSTGMRMGALNLLRIEDLTEQKYNGVALYKIQIYARTTDAYYSFCTPECYDIIQKYLDYRERCGEKIRPSSPLIREQFNKDNPFTVNAPKFVTGKAIEYLIEHALESSGMRKVHEVHMSHGFRKFFVSTCESSGMKSLHVSMLAGHDTGIKRPYYLPNESVILEDYMSHSMAALSILDDSGLQLENAQLRKNQSDYLAEINDFRQEFNEMKQFFIHLSKESQMIA